jgi:hypothetical protein
MSDSTNKQIKRKAPKTAWKKGQSGNPGGRIGVPKEVREAAREYSDEAIETLAKWMRSDDPRASVKSAEVLLDRAWGSCPQKQEISGIDGKPLATSIAGLVLRFDDVNDVTDADTSQQPEPKPTKAS